MDSLWKLMYLLEPAPVTLITTAVAVTFGSAFRALNYGKEMARNHDMSEASITLDRSQALMIPVMSSFSLLLMFYLFSSVSQLLTAFTAVASVSSFFFCLSPYAAYLNTIVCMLFYSGCLACFWSLDTEQFVGHIYMHCICKPCASAEHRDLRNASILSIRV